MAAILHFYFHLDNILTIFSRHQRRKKNIIAATFTLLQIWGAFFQMISSIIIDSKLFLFCCSLCPSLTMCRLWSVKSTEDSLNVHFSLKSRQIKSIGWVFVKLKLSGISGMFNLDIYKLYTFENLFKILKEWDQRKNTESCFMKEILHFLCWDWTTRDSF